MAFIKTTLARTRSTIKSKLIIFYMNPIIQVRNLITSQLGYGWIARAKHQAFVVINEDAVCLDCDLFFDRHSCVFEIAQ